MNTKRFRVSTNQGWSVIIWWAYIPNALDRGSYYFKFSDSRAVHRDMFTQTEEQLLKDIAENFEEYELEEI